MPQLRVEDFDEATSSLTVSYESGCETANNSIYYGPLANLKEYGYSGEVCAIGVDGMTTFDLPAGSLFFVIAGDDNAVEGSYGRDTFGFERPAAETCGLGRDLSAPCEAP